MEQSKDFLEQTKSTSASELFSLGKLYPSDFLHLGQEPRCDPVDLTLIRDSKGLVRLKEIAPKEAMYGRYWYRSGINHTMYNELRDIVRSVLQLMRFSENSVWLDIACNDGTLLSFVPNETFIRIGIDPADDTFKKESEQHADLIIQDYFDAEYYQTSIFGRQKASVVTSIAMFYDLVNPGKFIEDVYNVLDDDGLWVMQLSYSPLMIHQTAFDNICHEHIYYYCLTDLRKLLYYYGFLVVDCQINDINGGSFRLYIQKTCARRGSFGTQPYRDVCGVRIESILEYEKKIDIMGNDLWLEFFGKIELLKHTVRGFIIREVNAGKSVWAYAASTKGNTMLQYFGLDNTLITAIAERNFDKWGLQTVGTNIPIVPESEMRSRKPDYVLILAWHFIREFTEREADYLATGGKFIVPCPQFEIISS